MSSELLCFKKDDSIFHVSSLGQLQIVVVCRNEGLSGDSDQKLRFFDFRESLAKQIRDDGIVGKEQALTLGRYV